MCFERQVRICDCIYIPVSTKGHVDVSRHSDTDLRVATAVAGSQGPKGVEVRVGVLIRVIVDACAAAAHTAGDCVRGIPDFRPRSLCMLDCRIPTPYSLYVATRRPAGSRQSLIHYCCDGALAADMWQEDMRLRN